MALIVNSREEDLCNQIKNKLLATNELDQGGPLILNLMLDIIFSTTDQPLRTLMDRLIHMKVMEYSGEEISHITGFVHGAYTILHNCEFVSPDFMQILYHVFCTALDDEFVKHVGTIKTNQQLNLLSDLAVETLLDDIKSCYIAKKTAGQWAKVFDEQQQSILVG
eukprot:1676952-Ditylum_brightwellii.AAC.1